MSISNNIAELRNALPILLEKEKAGLIIPDSHRKAKDLIAWFDRGQSLSDKQELFVGRLLARAKRKHPRTTLNVNVGSNVNADQVAAQVLEKIGDVGVDMAALTEQVMAKIDTSYRKQVEANVLAALDARVARAVEITVKSAEGKKLSTTKGPVHVKFEQLVRAASVRLQAGYVPGIFMQGEASSGKTTGAKMLAGALKLDWWFNGAISFPHEMLGFIDGGGKYHRTPFRDAYEYGGVYTFDEVDRSDPVALLAVNPHLANGIATFPDKQVKRHPNCIIVCTANTWGLGADANYSGATKLDAAFLSRFPIRINWDIDSKLEEMIVPNAEWLARVRRARDRARAVGLKVMIDTRIAQAGAALIADGGFSMDEAAEMTYLANLKPQQRQQIEG